MGYWLSIKIMVIIYSCNIISGMPCLRCHSWGSSMCSKQERDTERGGGVREREVIPRTSRGPDELPPTITWG